MRHRRGSRVIQQKDQEKRMRNVNSRLSEEQDIIRVKFLFMYKHHFLIQIDLNASFTKFTRLLTIMSHPIMLILLCRVPVGYL